MADSPFSLRSVAVASWVTLLVLPGCRGSQADELCDEGARPGDLTINEIVADNEGVWIDEEGETEDYVELVNTSSRALSLGDFSIRDTSVEVALPDRELDPGERILLWADSDEEDGEHHLPFKLSSQGETVRISSCGEAIDEVAFPALHENDSYARFPDGDGELRVCRYASPNSTNGEVCAPPDPRGLPEEQRFLPYDFPPVHQQLPDSLMLSELAIRPPDGETAFIEIENRADETIDLAGHSLSFSAIAPGQPFPQRNQGEVLWLGPAGALGPGERAVVEIPPERLAPLRLSPAFEGAVTLYGPSTSLVLDRVDFMRWPKGASLTRRSADPGRFVFCDETSPGEQNRCDIRASRNVGDRVRALRTLGDFAALAQGGVTLGASAVKFIVDVDQDDAVHLLRAADWALHYTFVREVIDGEPPLDRCDEDQREAFNQGWYDFSVFEYFSEAPREYFMGTLVKYGSTAHRTVEYAMGDVILPSDIQRSFFAVAERTLDPPSWSVRPQSASQVERVREVEGELPLLPTNAPFAELTYQPLTHGVGYGVLTFVPANALGSESLGAQTLLVTDDVPNDIPLVGGLITEAFQTPLSHVNVLSQNRGTPNMALREALSDERITQHLGELVRLEVSGDDFRISAADPGEAAAFWEEFRPNGPPQSPRLDLAHTALVDLQDASLDDIPRIGAKAAQLAELMRVEAELPKVCSSGISYRTPQGAFAIPVAHFFEHFESSGAQELYEDLSQRSDFSTDQAARAGYLQQVQTRIAGQPVDAELLELVEAEVERRFGSERVRFRSSSNAEDLPGFNGAGLYTSTSAELGDEQRTVEDALRVVWASLFNSRAYDERELSRVEHREVGMAVLVNEAFTREAANGVGVSRNVLDPIRGDIYYLNTQAGEASVTNPAPGIVTEALEFQWPPRAPLLTYLSASSFTAGQPVMEQAEAIGVACALRGIHDHFRPLLDPDAEDPWFAMEIEFKLRYPSRELVVKQARSHTFGGFDVAGDCREL